MIKKIIKTIYILPFLTFFVFGFIYRTARGAFLIGQEYASDFSKWLGR